MGISSNSVIHFTNHKDKLQGILSVGFRVKYCLETTYVKSGKISAAIPMVSFCDIPLSEIKNHISKYGSYGIGLRKEWAIEQGLNPVLYIDSNSFLGENLREALRKYTDGKRLDDDMRKLLDVARFIKNYQHDLVRNEEIHNGYRFYDEREWRYVPNINIAEIEFVINPEEYLHNKDEFNKSASEIKLCFAPTDISYIILNDESEISDFIVFLRNTFRRSPLEDVDTLITRIITVDQIYHDF